LTIQSIDKESLGKWAKTDLSVGNYLRDVFTPKGLKKINQDLYNQHSLLVSAKLIAIGVYFIKYQYKQSLKYNNRDYNGWYFGAI